MSCSWSPVTLGRSDLTVVPLGLAASYGIPGREVERAFERGLNLFYWGALRSPVFPRAADFGRSLKRVAGRHRDKVVIVIQSYARSADRMTRSIEKGLRGLGIDYTDILLLGWWNLPPPEPVMAAAGDLVHRGRARQIMISCHNRRNFRALASDPRVGHIMVRYNAAHAGAERDVFPHLSVPRPGVIAYTATSWSQMLDPTLAPDGERVPTAADCYRFVLSNPYVDACYTGARTGDELDGAMRALDLGPMSEDEIAWMRRVGTSVRERTRLHTRGRTVVDRFMNLMSGFGFSRTDELD